jgi:hypothetical protein
MDSEFLQLSAIILLEPRAAIARTAGGRPAVLSVERPGATHKWTAPKIKPQQPLRVPRNADPHALSDFPLADLAGLMAIAL